MPAQRSGDPARAVSLDDLFGGGRGGDVPSDAGWDEPADVESGSWADPATASGTDSEAEPGAGPGAGPDDDTGTVGLAGGSPADPDGSGDVPVAEPRPITFDEPIADDEPAGGAEAGPAAVRPLSVDELTGDRESPEGDEVARTVSFDDLSAGHRRTSPRRSADGGRPGPVNGGGPGAPETRRTGRSGGRSRRARSRDDGHPGDGAGSGGAATEGRTRSEDRARPDGPRERRGRRRGPAIPENETPAEQESRAKDICLRLLTDRARTVSELGDALRRKEIPDEIAHRVLDRFDEVGLVDDKAFAEQWVRSRHRYRGLGKRAIAQELQRKGVDRETADEALTEIDDDSERERARELVVRRLRGLPIGSREERQSTARKLVGMLARKGYGPGVAYGVVKEEIAAAGADADELGEAPEE